MQINEKILCISDNETVKIWQKFGKNNKKYLYISNLL